MNINDLVKSVLDGQARHLATMGAGALVTLGALDPKLQTAAVQIGAGVLLWGVGAGLSAAQKFLAHSNAAKAVETAAATAAAKVATIAAAAPAPATPSQPAA